MNLDAKTLYYMACLNAFQDGQTDPRETDILERLRSALRMSGVDARDIEAKAREDMEEGNSEATPLDAKKLFSAACRLSIVDEVLEIGEAERLTDLSEILGIEFEEAEKIFEAVRAEEP